MNKYTPLRNFTNMSLGESIITNSDLFKKSKELGFTSVGMCNRMNLFGILDFTYNALENKIKPIVGSLIKISNDTESLGFLPVFIKNEDGYQFLSEILTDAYLNNSQDPYIHILTLLNSKDLIVLTGDMEGYLYKLLIESKYQEANDFLLNLKGYLGDNLYIEVNSKFSEEVQKHIVSLGYKLNIPLVGTHSTSFCEKEDYECAFIFSCIHTKEFFENDIFEESSQSLEYLLPLEELSKYILPLKELYENSLIISQRCSFIIQKRPQISPSFSGSNEKDTIMFQKSTRDALEIKIELFPDDKKTIYRNRLEFELTVICDKNFSGYFLIVSEFIIWAKNNGIPVGTGRGSGAGSIAAWLLQITDIDPIFFGLFFERFLNPERVSMPDFDIDFCQERREEVIRYVANKYGKKRVAHIITFGSMKARMAIRDVGRVLKMSFGLTFKISSMIPTSLNQVVTIQSAIDSNPVLADFIRNGDEQIQKLIIVSKKLEGLIRQSASHASGVVITTEEDLTKKMPLYRDLNGEICTQFNMHDVEKVGLIKFDFLGLKTITVIDHCVKMIKEIHSDIIDFNKIPLDDKKSFKIIIDAHVAGLFQIESSIMKHVIKTMKPDNIDDIIALVALVRPGPLEEIPRYIRRKHNKEPILYPHPMIEETLKPTFGIIVYQEQVMEIAKIMAGYSLGEADLLRRAMGKKKLDEMIAQRERFLTGSKKNNVDVNIANSIFDQMEKFAEYAFNKSHAACYAIICYQTAYLKSHYPAEFFCSSMNLEIDNTEKLFTFFIDIKLMNIEIIPPSINISKEQFFPNNGKVVYGLQAIKGVGSAVSKAIIKNAPYKTIEEFIEKNKKDLNKRSIEQLVFSGSLDCLNKNRKVTLNYCNMIHKDGSVHTNLIPEDVEDYSNREKIDKERNAFGFFLNKHPIDLYFNKIRMIQLKPLSYIPNKNESFFLLCVIEKITKRKTRKGKPSIFAFLRVSDHTGSEEVTVFSNVLKDCSESIEERNIVVLEVDFMKSHDGGNDRINVKKIVSLLDFLKKETKSVVITVNSRISLIKGQKYLEKIEEGKVEVVIQCLEKKFPYNKKIEISQKVLDDNTIDISFF
jgi:DNA polymerase-3 subunit alpha